MSEDAHQCEGDFNTEFESCKQSCRPGANDWDILREFEVRRNREIAATVKAIMTDLRFNRSPSPERASACQKLQEAIFWLEAGHTFA